MAYQWRLSQVLDVADQLRSAANNTEGNLRETFQGWVEATAEAMADEIPKDTHDTADSVTIEWGDGLSASIGPTNTDESGRPVAVFIAYGTGRQSPDDFIGRTAARTEETLGDFDIREVL